MHYLSEPICHGHLTSHNIFVEQDSFQGYKVWVSDLELQPFIKFGAFFNNYLLASVWSAPEVHFQQKIQDFNKAMDVYSFSIVFWEILHEQVPFDNNINLAKSFVCQEHARPQISDQIDIEVAKLIRMCWLHNPDQRPGFSYIYSRI